MSTTTTSTMDWTNLLPEGLGEREKNPRTIRFPKDLAAELEELAAETGHEFTETTLRLLKAAVAQVRSSRSAKKLKKAV